MTDTSNILKGREIILAVTVARTADIAEAGFGTLA